MKTVLSLIAMVKRWLYVVIAVAVVLVAAIIMPMMMKKERNREFRPTHRALRTVAFAQLDYYENDRDKNGIKDYWKKDVAGLFALLSDGEPLALIERAIAGADKSPKVDIAQYAPSQPRLGYWYQAIPCESEDVPDPTTFAVCAFPASYSPMGDYTYIVSTDGVVYRKDLGPEGRVTKYPKDPASDGWERLN